MEASMNAIAKFFVIAKHSLVVQFVIERLVSVVVSGLIVYGGYRFFLL
jgi:hypothetical protein